MANESILIVSSENQTASLLESVVLSPAGYVVTIVEDCETADRLIRAKAPQLVIMCEKIAKGNGLEAIAGLINDFPGVPVAYLPAHHSDAVELKAWQSGVTQYIPPGQASDIQKAVLKCIERGRRMYEWSNLQTHRNTKSLQQRVDGLEALQRIGRSVTALLDLDGVLKAVVDAAVELTGAEEGSLLLVDESTGELYMRASRNFHEDFVRTFRLPIRDTLPGQVLRTGRPLFLQQDTPQKIKTSYLVYHLVYVPLTVQARVIGVLGVDNKHSGNPLQEHHIMIMSALADYAAIAIENARLYSKTDYERKKLESILTKVADGVLVVDSDNRIVVLNETIRDALSITDHHFSGRRLEEVIQQEDLLDLLRVEKRNEPLHSEIEVEDGRIFNANLTAIPEIGTAIIMQDITHLKELDRIKSEFVATVSHDLRSPLTAILGYVELIERVGAINDQQKEFVRRVQFSVNNITSLINDLLDLGRIEAGFDSLKEIVPFGAIVQYSLDSLASRIQEKKLDMDIRLPEDLPSVLGNPVRLRQMTSNLIGNAIKYTPQGGRIAIFGSSEEGQIIFRVSDNGPGIPPGEQPYIFNKFYRASNVPGDSQGTGLGLAIVKSIVENHMGRIWVESSLGHGSTFTVVLPVTSGDEKPVG